MVLDFVDGFMIWGWIEEGSGRRNERWLEDDDEEKELEKMKRGRKDLVLIMYFLRIGI